MLTHCRSAVCSGTRGPAWNDLSTLHELLFIFVLAQALVASPTPSPSPTPSTPPLIGSVSIATGSLETLHRLPLPASLLTAEQIQANPAITSDQLLRALPGYDHTRSNSAFTNYGQLRASFSGAGNDRGLVLVDNIFAQDAFGGQIDWAAYPANDITRAELLRGPGSALYGSGAVGGVLSLGTYAPTTQPNGPASGTLEILPGTNAYLNEHLQTTTPITSKFSTSLSASDQQLSYSALAPGYQAPIDTNAFARSKMVSLKFRYAPDASTTIDYGYRGAWDYQQYGRPNYDFWRDFIQNALAFAHKWTHASVSVTGYVRNTFVTNRADKSSSPGSLLYTQYVPTHESGVIADWIVDSPNSTFEIRGDGRFVGGVSRQLNAANIQTANGSGVQQISDIAVQNTWRFNRAEAVAGLAATSIFLPNASLTSNGTIRTIAPRTDRALSPRIAVRYDLAPHLAFRASGGSGLRAPYLNELVRGYVIGPTSYVPNPNLVPERTYSQTAGFDWTNQHSEFAADYIQTFVSDAISFRTIDPTHQMRSNFAHAETNGVTASYTERIGTCSTLSVWGTQQNSRVTGGSAAIGKQLPYVPEGSAYAGYSTLLGTTRVGVNVSYIGQTYADDLNLEPLGTAVTAGLFASVPVAAGVRLVLQGDNVTDARYLSSIDRFAPPSVISLGLQLPVNKQAPASCPG